MNLPSSLCSQLLKIRKSHILVIICTQFRASVETARPLICSDMYSQEPQESFRDNLVILILQKYFFIHFSKLDSCLLFLLLLNYN